VKWYQLIFQKCGRGSFVRFVNKLVWSTNLRCVFVSRICMLNLNLLDFDLDQEYIYFIWSETLPSACYILYNESSIHFYSTSNGYKYKFSEVNLPPVFVQFFFPHQFSVSLIIDLDVMMSRLVIFTCSFQFSWTFFRCVIRFLLDVELWMLSDGWTNRF